MNRPQPERLPRLSPGPLLRNRIASNTAPISVHAIPSVTQKSRIVNDAFQVVDVADCRRKRGLFNPDGSSMVFAGSPFSSGEGARSTRVSTLDLGVGFRGRWSGYVRGPAITHLPGPQVVVEDHNKSATVIRDPRCLHQAL